MESLWSQTCRLRQREALPGDMKTDIAVIGAGMAGILIASALQEAGRRVVVLEAERIAGGQTRNTTAKLTCQHGLVYEKLIRTLGEEKARQYAQANAAALMEYRRIIADRNIDCDLEQRDAWAYGSNAAQLRKEAEAAAALGLPATFVEETKLPFPTAGAVRFANQAQFHPLKFLQAISEPLTIYENTSVQSVEEDQIVTTRGRVQAEQIVFACHYPFVNFPGMYFARMHQERSYVIALENAAPMDGMWIGAEQGAYSFRNYGPLLLLGAGATAAGRTAPAAAMIFCGSRRPGGFRAAGKWPIGRPRTASRRTAFPTSAPTPPAGPIGSWPPAFRNGA